MRQTRERLQSILNARDFPGEILTGVPVVEVHGASEAVVIHHRGVLAYGPERIRVASAIGPLTVEGEGLEIFRMNRERILLHGRVHSVRIGGDERC